jgi:hypothetical protein
MKEEQSHLKEQIKEKGGKIVKKFYVYNKFIVHNILRMSRKREQKNKLKVFEDIKIILIILCA